jgi:hypothetical protein
LANAVFDFNAPNGFAPSFNPDVDGTSPTVDTSVVGTGSLSGSVTEQGVVFTYSSTNAGNTNFSAQFINLSVSDGGTGTLDIDDTPDEDFFSDLVFDFASVGGYNSIVLSRTLTASGAALGAPVTTVITNGQIGAGTVTAPAGQWNTIQFKPSGGAFMELSSITSTVNCFLPGTAIATETGEAAVETLTPGDLVRTADGRLEAVVWLGEMKIDTRLMHPAKVNPVCITAGALGGGLPGRDLYLSADHAVEIDGVLYNAGALINGTTIYQVAQMPLEGFVYYHVETDGHELLLAEGMAAESFVDYVGRDGFDNADRADRRTIPEMNLPRVSSRRLVPMQLRDRLAPTPVAA